MRYYFNLEDGKTVLDSIGTDFPDLKAAQASATKAATELLHNGSGVNIWDGHTWRLWATTEPDGKGAVLFSLRFSGTVEGG